MGMRKLKKNVVTNITSAQVAVDQASKNAAIYLRTSMAKILIA